MPDEPVFSRPALRALGWSDSAIDRAIASGRLVQVRRGWFARTTDHTERNAAVAAERANSGAVLSDRSGALMHGIPIIGAKATVPALTVPPHSHANLKVAHAYRSTLSANEIVIVDGVAVTSVARTLVDLGRHRTTACSVTAIDHALHNGLVTMNELDETLRRCWNWPGIRRAQRAVRLADARAESPLESISRLVLRWLHLPPPEPQVIAIDRWGFPAGRFDFYWEVRRRRRSRRQAEVPR